MDERRSGRRAAAWTFARALGAWGVAAALATSCAGAPPRGDGPPPERSPWTLDAASRVDGSFDAEESGRAEASGPHVTTRDARGDAGGDARGDAGVSTPSWARGALAERLAALGVGEADWARSRLFTWTTREQVADLRRDGVLLTATAKVRGPPSPFVYGIDALSRRRGAVGKLAAALASGPRFARRRYAWTAAYATVLGLAQKRYGDELVTIELRPDAWVVHFDPEREPPLRVRDLSQVEIPLERAVQELERVGAVYHVRAGRDVPTPFREYVVVQDSAIERWAVGTDDVRAEVSAELALLHDLRAEAARGGAPLAAAWRQTLAFKNDRYGALDPAHVDRIIEGLSAWHAATEPLEGGGPR